MLKHTLPAHSRQGWTLLISLRFTYCFLGVRLASVEMWNRCIPRRGFAGRGARPSVLVISRLPQRREGSVRPIRCVRIAGTF